MGEKNKNKIEHLPSKLAIAGLIGGVALYDIKCPKGETISEGVDRLLEKHKLATLGTIAVTALHLGNVLPDRYDPIHNMFKMIKGEHEK